MIQGSIVALITPMALDGSIDWDALDHLIEWHIESGTDGIVSVGTSGESPTLPVKEHLKVIEHTVQRVNKRIPVIAGTGANSTYEATELTLEAGRFGADASLQVVPYYNKPTQEGLYQHFSTIADAVEIPLILYNVPARTVADLEPPTVARLAAHENIIGVKEATGNLERGQQVLDCVPRDFIVLSGDDPTAAQFMKMGARGDISVTANVAPKLMHELCAACLAGDFALAEQIDAQLQPLHHALFVEPNPIPVKWAVAAMGRAPAGIRLPLTPLSAEGQAKLAPVMKSMGLIN